MERERITISIKKKVLAQIDKFIDGVSVRNRSHAIETLALTALGKIGSLKAVIILGGDDALKAIPVADKFLKSLASFGVSKVIVAVGFLGDKIKDKLGEGSKYGLEIDYSDKGEGSGGALVSLKKEINGTFLVLNTKENAKYDLSTLIDQHHRFKPLATIATNNMSDMKGIYIFEPEVINLIPRGFSMLEDETLAKIIKAKEGIILPLDQED